MFTEESQQKFQELLKLLGTKDPNMLINYFHNYFLGIHYQTEQKIEALTVMGDKAVKRMEEIGSNDNKMSYIVSRIVDELRVERELIFDILDDTDMTMTHDIMIQEKLLKGLEVQSKLLKASMGYIEPVDRKKLEIKEKELGLKMLDMQSKALQLQLKTKGLK